MRKNSLLATILGLVMIGFCFLFPHFGGFPIFIYPLIVFAALWIFLKYVSKEKLSDLFFSFRRFEVKAIWIAIPAALALSLFFQYVWTPLIDHILPGKVDLSDFAFIKNNPVNYALIMFLALVVGGFYEELVFHGFVFSRFEKIFSKKYATAISFILTNLLFGAYHFQQGIKGVLVATIAGFAYQGLVLKFNRNLWYGIFFHAFFDFIGLTLIYLGVAL